jgi:hypothetical protein
MNNQTSKVAFGFVIAASLLAALGHCTSTRFDESAVTESTHTQRESIVTSNDTITQAADEARTGWYPDQASLSPAVVADSTQFGPLFPPVTLPLTAGEQVYAQPLVSADGKSVLVVTEQNNAYVFDAASGAIKASRAFGKSFNAQTALTPGCGDIASIHQGQGGVGITGTPVIDVASNTAYFVTKTVDANQNVSVTFHGVDATTLADHFATTLNGLTADNASFIAFDPETENQRSGLLFMGGIAYAAFGAHCDAPPFHGWIVGVSPTGQVVAKFSTEVTTIAGEYGAGIWQAGAGIISDGPTRMFVMTGNGYSPAPTSPIPGTSPNAFLDNSMVRLQVQANGTVVPVQWFNPVGLAAGDQDLGSGGAVALPAQFGTAPNLIVGAGKNAKLYVEDRDNLGGFMQGAGGGDQVLSTTQLAGSVFSKPGVWPGDQLIYITSNGGPMQALQFSRAGGTPTFTVTGVSQTKGKTDVWGQGTGSPIVTSNGTTTGTALVWVIDNGGTLHAYDAVPVNGAMTERFSTSIGVDAKFSIPGVGQGALYVGTGDGHFLGFGVQAGPLVGDTVSFGSVVLGMHATQTATFTATAATTITGLTATNPAFTLNAPTPAFGTQLAVGQTVTVPVTFTPSTASFYSAQLNATTSTGNGGTVGLSGTGTSSGPGLSAAPTSLAFGNVVTGTTASQNTLLTNTGSQTLTFGSLSLTSPDTPFSVTSAPAANSTLAPNASIPLTVQFAPMTSANFTNSVTIQSDSLGGTLTVPLSGGGGTAPHLVISSLSLDYGDVPVGSTHSMSFTVSNTGGSNLTITKSKPPAAGLFIPQTSLPEGTVIASGMSLTETVSITPTTAGSFTDFWTLDGDDGGMARVVTFTAIATSEDASSSAIAMTEDASPASEAGAGSAATTGTSMGGSVPETASRGAGCAIVGMSASPRAAGPLALLALVVVGRRATRRQPRRGGAERAARGAIASE